MQFPVVDIFAGPGGLSEGFSRFRPKASGERVFRVVASAEKDPAAHATLLLRAFVRQFEEGPPRAYYEYLRNPKGPPPFSATHRAEWEAAAGEALCVTLGESADTQYFHEAIRTKIGRNDSWVLIGGPPCQAYSLVGRSRNKGVRGYRVERDNRHYLYREYLGILSRFRPAVFIMENVKGILSAQVHGSPIFEQILADLADPGRSLGAQTTARYEILPLGTYTTETRQDASRFVVRSEDFGIPQARHRVILLGVRSDIDHNGFGCLTSIKRARLADAWFGLPPLRSGLTERQDTSNSWLATVENQRRLVLRGLTRKLASTGEVLRALRFPRGLERGGTSIRALASRFDSRVAHPLQRWLRDDQLGLVLNHESRGHMDSDLGRYMFCAAFAEANDGRSPTSGEFPRALAPTHVNWSTGAFADRFRVHSPSNPSATITSHISKDGHYYIHYSPEQCRSMTVREAARLQTFPDNYFFTGNRSQQYIQVGNAVPPLLACQIAEIIWRVLVGKRVSGSGNVGRVAR